MTFSNGEVTSITKSWMPGDEPDVTSVMRAIANALETLQGADGSCHVTSSRRSKPDYLSQATEVQCGKRKIVVTVSTYRGQVSHSVEERWESSQ